MSGWRETISIAEMVGGQRLIQKEGEIFVLKSLRQQMISNLHVTYSSDGMMIWNVKHCIFWPQRSRFQRMLWKMSGMLRTTFESSGEHKSFLPKFIHEIWARIASGVRMSGKTLCWFVVKFQGFLKCHIHEKKSTRGSLQVLREWGSIYGRLYRVKTDGGPSYREEFKSECKKLGMEVIHLSSYNSQSQGLIERIKAGVWIQGNSNPASNPVNISTP